MKKLFELDNRFNRAVVILFYSLVFNANANTEPMPEQEELAGEFKKQSPISLIQRKDVNGVTCVQCHGLTGHPAISETSLKQVPNLAGQDMSYLYDQLINFKSGYRVTNEMKGSLNQYTDDELQSIAHYYAGQSIGTSQAIDVSLDPLRHTQKEDDAWAKLGAILYLKGDDKRGIEACQNCHGVYGEGRIIGLDKAPKLTGQHARYVRMTLESYSKGKRTTDNLFDNPMQMISQKLNEKDRRHLGAYIQKLKLPESHTN